MSITVRDVRCPVGHYEIDVYVNMPDIPRCPECGEERHVFYATREMSRDAVSDSRIGVFKPVTIEGVTYSTREDFDRFKNAYARNMKVDPSQVEVVGNADHVQRGEEARHRGWETRRKNGIDDRQLREHQHEQKRRTAEQRGHR